MRVADMNWMQMEEYLMGDDRAVQATYVAGALKYSRTTQRERVAASTEGLDDPILFRR